jgi:hypothetical protein
MAKVRIFSTVPPLISCFALNITENTIFVLLLKSIFMFFFQDARQPDGSKFPLARRDEVLNFIGHQVVKDQTTGGRDYFKIEENWLNIYG